MDLEAFAHRAQYVGVADLKATDQLCSYCLARHGRTKDHVVPRSKGGGNVNNTVPACYDCNVRKGSLSLIQWLMGERTLPQYKALTWTIGEALAVPRRRSEWSCQRLAKRKAARLANKLERVAKRDARNRALAGAARSGMDAMEFLKKWSEGWRPT